MTPADLEFISRMLSPFDRPVFLLPYDAVCGECGLMIETDVTGECPQCLTPTKEGQRDRA